jgi:MoxR-like ATPase
MPDPRATVLLLSGAPGSGKTTLAAALAVELGWPHVHRDELYAGLMAGGTLGRDEVVPHDTPSVASLVSWVTGGSD